MMIKTFNNIYENIKHKFNVDYSSGIIGDHLMSDVTTIKTTVSLPKTKYKSCSILTVSNDMSDEQVLMNRIKREMIFEPIKKLWRLNDKRVRHGLKSWI